MVTYESIYPGVEYLMPKYSPVGYQAEVGQLGMSGDPRTANQLGDLNIKMNPGETSFEVQGTSAAVLEAVPEQHLDEIRRLTKLADVKPSFHGPIVEASGVGEGGWEEANRLGAEKQIESAVLRSHKLDPKGNISVTLHTTAGIPEMEPTIKVKDKDGKLIEKPTGGLWVVDPETGRVGQLPREKRYFPEEGEEFTGKEKPFEPLKELKKFNEDQWTQRLSDVNRMANYGEEIVDGVKKRFQSMGIKPEVFNEVIKGADFSQLEEEEKFPRDLFMDAQRSVGHGQIYLRDSYRNLKKLFDMAYANSSGKDREKLNEFAESAQKKIQPGFETDPQKLNQLGEVIEDGINVLKKMSPEVFKPLKKFVIDKTAETFANVAGSTYDKFGDTSPILNIENPPAGGGLSRAEGVKAVVEETRKKFTEDLMKDKGISKSEAKEISEKMVGATWDVGHINMLRKKGFSEKDIIKETEKIAPYVKHVHLSDNFGFEHTELPMGMGNVPMKEIMGKLGEKGFEGQKIIEAGSWWQYLAEHGGGNPFKPTIEAFDSPIYAMKEGRSWSQAGMPGAYYSGHGQINPPVHHSLYGASFTGLPAELGGEMPGGGERGRLAKAA